MPRDDCVLDSEGIQLLVWQAASLSVKVHIGKKLERASLLLALQINQLCIENIWEKVPESFIKQNVNFPYGRQLLHSIYIVIGAISNLEMI